MHLSTRFIAIAAIGAIFLFTSDSTPALFLNSFRAQHGLPRLAASTRAAPWFETPRYARLLTMRPNRAS